MLKRITPVITILLLLASAVGVAATAPITQVGGTFFHDEVGDGVLKPWYQGVEQAEASLDGLSYTTGTSGWYTFPGLEPGEYTLEGTPTAGSWWIPTLPEQHDLTLGTGDSAIRNFGYWWGLDGPGASVDATAASNQAVYGAERDATVHQWLAGTQGGDIYLKVRQPAIASALLKFDVSTLPADAQIQSATLRLCSIVQSNPYNRLYLAVYPLLEDWNEATATWPEPAYDAPNGWDWLPKMPPLFNGHIPNGFVDLVQGEFSGEVIYVKLFGPQCVKIDLDPATIAGWLADASSNHGLIVRGEGSPNREVEHWFASREHPNGPWPQLTVGYDLP